MSQYTQSIKPTITSSQSQMDTSDSKTNAMVEGTLEQTIRSGVAHVRVRECSYTWTITNMSFNLRAYQHDEYIWSSKFQAGSSDEYVFRLLLYPDGCNDEHQDYICVEIQNYGDTIIEDGQIYVELAMLHTSSGEERFAKTEIFYPQKGKVRLVFHNFMKKMVMMDLSNGLLVDDQVILKCRLYFDSKIVERFMPDSEVRKEEVKPDCRLREFDEFEQMLENGVFSDARLRVEGVELRVHRAVLATRSRVFAEMMAQAATTTENKQEDFVLVDVPDVKVDVIRELLRFVYAGKVNNVDTVAKDLLVAAIKFELEGLKITCEETLVRGLSIENVGEMLAFADKHKAEMLAKCAMEFFTANAKRVVGTDNFKSTMQSCPFWITAMVNTLVQKLE